MASPLALNPWGASFKNPGRPTVAVLGMYLAACAPALQRPSVEVVEVAVTSLGLTGGSAEVGLLLGNPNDFRLHLAQVEYSVDVREDRGVGAWTPLIRGSSSPEVTLPPGQDVSVTLEVPFGYDGIGAAVRSLLRTGEIAYRIRGRVRVGSPWGELTGPFDASGVIRPG